jgi:hypothetical protein
MDMYFTWILGLLSGFTRACFPLSEGSLWPIFLFLFIRYILGRFSARPISFKNNLFKYPMNVHVASFLFW